MTTPGQESLAPLAQAAVQLVQNDMVLGLGTGRAAEAFIEALGQRVRGGLRVTGIPTSDRSRAMAERVGVPLTDFERTERLHLAFDGADEVAPGLMLTKGLGGALLRERIVAREAARFIVLVTAEKLVEKLGTRAPIPVEIVPFSIHTATRRLAKLGGRPAHRKKSDGFPFVTDNGNWIVDVHVEPLSDPREFDAAVRAIPGVVDTGLFLGMASSVLVAESGRVRELPA